MASLTTFLTNKVLEHITGKTAYTIPTVYVGLSSTTPLINGTGATEPSGGAYARVPTSGTDWGTAAAGVIANATTLSFPTATADWVAGANLTYVVLYDAATLGNLVGFGAITVPQPVLNGNTAAIPVGDITITLS